MSVSPDRQKNSRTLLIAATAYTVLLTYLLLAPHPLWIFGATGRTVEQAVDSTLCTYAQHGLAYAVLGWMVIWASRRTARSSQVFWVLLTIGHGLLAEWLQQFVPFRYAIWPDALANTLGVCVGVMAALIAFSAAGVPTTRSLRRSTEDASTGTQRG